jgi:hypothetical protein
MARILAPR